MIGQKREEFQICLMKLMALGQFYTVIETIKRHADYSPQDIWCKKIVDELDSVHRMLINAESAGGDQMQS